MKHSLKITLVLLGMFLITQFIGLGILYADPLTIQANINGTVQEVDNPYLDWINVPEAQTQGEFNSLFFQLLVAFILAISLLFILMKFRVEVFLRLWFFMVVSIALFLAILGIEKLLPFVISLKTALITAAVLGVGLSFVKIFRRNILIHNITELLIYPGIAVVFVPILNVYTIILLLILISVYDMWAVWHSGIMQKMAKYQINNLRIFGGFFVPYLSKKQRQELKKIKLQKQKSKSSKLKEKKIKVNVAILGGGDVVFPLITAGVMLNTFGFLPALFVIIGATLGLSYLFFLAEKKKFYPAMPFITTGIFIGLAINWLINIL